MKQEKENKSSGMDRRAFLKSAGIGALSLGAGSSILIKKPTAGAASTPKDRVAAEAVSRGPYNILFILTDQERCFDVYPQGYRLPGHERLTGSGITFTNH